MIPIRFDFLSPANGVPVHRRTEAMGVVVGVHAYSLL